ncbi:MAG: hypothetical protein COB93_07445 [Sneathiella sp.]|nr:MAG: hypothetical protein COB93_07445 [Sneathiella sp.]
MFHLSLSKGIYHRENSLLVQKDKIDMDMSIDRIMRIWPQTISVILKHRMKCVGCPLATFHSAIDAAREHGIDADILFNDLERVI